MSKTKKRKPRETAPDVVPGPDGLVLVEVVEARNGRDEGDTYKVDPLRAKKLLELGLAKLPGKEKSDG